jgi:hypothetical protein
VQRGVDVGSLRAFIFMPWLRSAEYSVERFFDGTQGDPIVLGSDQEIEAGKRVIEKLWLAVNSSASATSNCSRSSLRLWIFSARAWPPRARSF